MAQIFCGEAQLRSHLLLVCKPELSSFVVAESHDGGKASVVPVDVRRRGVVDVQADGSEALRSLSLKGRLFEKTEEQLAKKAFVEAARTGNVEVTASIPHDAYCDASDGVCRRIFALRKGKFSCREKIQERLHGFILKASDKVLWFSHYYFFRSRKNEFFSRSPVALKSGIIDEIPSV
jgi:hypothetical protein